MTAIKGTKAKLLVDEFDFSGDTAGFTVTTTMGAGDVTTLQADAMLSAAILPSMKIEHNGYVLGVKDDGTFEAELKRRLGVSGVYVAILLGTDEDACPAYVLDNTFGANLQMQAPVAGMMTLNGAWGEGDGGHIGKRVFEGTLDATGARTAYDFGAAGAAGGEAYLFVQAITGSITDGSILVESSATEGGTYATEATFTVNAVGAQKVALSGTVNRWLRLNVADLGGATEIAAVLVVCVAGVTE